MARFNHSILKQGQAGNNLNAARKAAIAWLHSGKRGIKLLSNLHVMNTVWRERQALAKLDENQLRDIGLHPSTVKREIEKGYFDIPEGRKNSHK